MSLIIRHRGKPGFLPAWLAAWLSLAGAAATAWARDPAAGRRIYREGVLASGEPVRATLQGDVEIRGRTASCATCHRPSGFGSNEGSSIVPAITGPLLFADRLPRRADLFRGLFQDPLPSPARTAVRTPRTRAAYDQKSLAVALRDGVDPDGRRLDRLMPRYAFGERDMNHLTAYLKTLGAAPDPGVDDTTIHFATVVSEGVDLEKRRAMLATIEAFLRRRNLEVDRDVRRPSASPYYKDEFRIARRRWDLHTWELAGPSATWEAQLEARYRERPVFALLGGLVAGSWAPVHCYCERLSIPCLFPLTDLPEVVEEDRPSSTVYFTRGLQGEAEALALWVSRAHPEGRLGPIVQVFRDTEEGRTLARAFRRAMPEARAARLQDVPAYAEVPSEEFWRRAVHDRKPSLLVLWLGPADLDAYSKTHSAAEDRLALYASSSLLGRTTMAIPERLRGRLGLTYPTTLPGSEEPHLFRVRSWFRAQGIADEHEVVRLNTYLTLSLTEHALERMVDHFSRDYFLECVEHELESMENPGVFPRLSLGPGQRYASKGCYIAAPARDRPGDLEAISSWIVP
jgi:hypothetical protein